MISSLHHYRVRAIQPTRRRRTRFIHRLALPAAIAILAVASSAAFIHFETPEERFAAFLDVGAQSVVVPETVMTVVVDRGAYSATPGIPTLVAGGTNYDWAKLVLLYGGWLMSDANVTVLVRWMRQENGPNDWWNRNNPLNNGWGSGGGGGTGTYASLTIAAQKAAEALGRNPGYSGIVANLAASSPTATTEAAIWASPWATGHYANGGHWHYSEVPSYQAPAGAWQ